jgi:hypothetical protein
MVYIILGHIFILAGMFLAFFAAGLAFYYAHLIKGGIAGKAALLNSFGYIFLAIMIFMGFSGAITGRFDLLNVTIFWPIFGLVILVCFAIIAYAQFMLLRLMGGH